MRVWGAVPTRPDVIGPVNRPCVLVTGGAGFIGSHACVELLAAGYQVIVIDNLSNSSPRALQRIDLLSGQRIVFVKCDLRDRTVLDELFASHRIDAVIHFAGKKAVGESVEAPLVYYDNNVNATIALLEGMDRHGVRRLVFSSSCSVYGQVASIPIDETSVPCPTNPYARTKWICEQILSDVCTKDSDWSVISLRYFNPTGAHPSGLLGEEPRGLPNNLMPYLMLVAAERLPQLRIFGGDYETPDGTGVRDYIHVVDVSDAHRVALEHFDDETGFRVFNIGTGVGTSVLDLISAFSSASGRSVPHEIVDRRPGDVAELVAAPAKVAEEWGWSAPRDLSAMCRDAWNFQCLNPDGYEDLHDRSLKSRALLSAH